MVVTLVVAGYSRVPVEDALIELKKSGLGSVPGTAAEIIVDSVRQKICPGKLLRANGATLSPLLTCLAYQQLRLYSMDMSRF